MRALNAVVAVLAGAVFAAAAVPPLPAPAQAKAELEAKMSREVSAILDRFLGPGRAHVTVFLNVSVKAAADDPSARQRRREQKVQAQWVWREVSKKPGRSMMPGFPVAPKVTVSDDKQNNSGSKPPAPADENEVPAYEIEVNRVLVSIVLDNEVSEKSRKMIEVMVAEVLGLDPDRGDRLNLYVLPLQPAWKWALGTPETLERVFWGGLGLAAILLVLFALSRLARRRAAEDAEKSDAGAAAPGAAGSAEAGESSAGFSLQRAEEGEPRHERLDFVTGENIDIFAELVKDREARDIACLLGFLDPALAARLLDHLTQERRLDVMLSLVSPSSLTPEQLAELRAAWRERLACAYGGTGMVGTLLSGLDERTQSEFLHRLSAAQPEMAPKVAEGLMRMDDLTLLSSADLAALVQTVPAEDWARALAPLPSSWKEGVLKAVPESAREVFEQCMALCRPSRQEAREAQMRVLGSLRALLRKGRIQLRRPEAAAKD